MGTAAAALAAAAEPAAGLGPAQPQWPQQQLMATALLAVCSGPCAAWRPAGCRYGSCPAAAHGPPRCHAGASRLRHWAHSGLSLLVRRGRRWLRLLLLLQLLLPPMQALLQHLARWQAAVLGEEGVARVAHKRTAASQPPPAIGAGVVWRCTVRTYPLHVSLPPLMRRLCRWLLLLLLPLLLLHGRCSLLLGSLWQMRRRRGRRLPLLLLGREQPPGQCGIA